MSQEMYAELCLLVSKQQVSPKQLNELKREIALKYHHPQIPTNIDLLLHAPASLVPVLQKQLLTKPTRSISGVAPVALMTQPSKCPHGKCTFCPGGIGSPWGDVPQSYTGHEPATMRGIRNDYDAYLMTFNRLQQYVLLGHNFDKVEIIVMGGTFPAEDVEYQEGFITDTYQALNDFSALFFVKDELDFVKFKEYFLLPGPLHDKDRENSIKTKLRQLKHSRKTSLEQEKKGNEQVKVRCVALCIETKPDWGFLEHGNVMLRQGCTRVELGIQSVYDDVLAHVHRGHDTADNKKSIQILRDLGFKINFHYMPGLPLTDRQRDIAGMKQVFTDEGYKPDMIKFYPCMVGPGTAMYYQWKAGTFTPITTEEAASRLAVIKPLVPEYCRIQRIQRDVPTKYWEDGVDRTNLRQYLHEQFRPVCRCIRCREPKGKKVDWTRIALTVYEFKASGGTEFFIAAEDPTNDVIIGFCRLRFPKESLRSEITLKTGLIRELHVYGTATAIGEEGVVQHRGWGTKLMEKAQEICEQRGKEKMVVISGVGVREYYRKLGYTDEGPYMVKTI